MVDFNPDDIDDFRARIDIHLKQAESAQDVLVDKIRTMEFPIGTFPEAEQFREHYLDRYDDYKDRLARYVLALETMDSALKKMVENWEENDKAMSENFQDFDSEFYGSR
ncbi:hypothetical protein [Haloglycomyces albus]|uniref:hypothetical protein n=1 Tax=Haloglycomyces albus TaxID=526067 RepID=UPI00046CECCC|nr:hypothetical protein [Haloglycomyces albus]